MLLPSLTSEFPHSVLEFSLICRHRRMLFHSVVCIDGNFEQKRCATAGGSANPIPRPQSMFLPVHEVQKMRALVESRRKDKKKKGEDQEDENATLNGLHLPNYLYEECTSRFTAANEANQKAESSIFTDTGLMALTCRHDHVLFLVNLQDAGEKQYNALALIQHLFDELPPTWRVGVLYDIGCQMHKSIIKVCHTVPCHDVSLTWGIGFL